MRNLKPSKGSNHDRQRPIFILKDTETATHVFIRVDAAKRPLQAPYEGPFPVLQRSNKTVTVKKPNGTVTVSIDRVKPAFTENDDQTIQPTEPTNETKADIHHTIQTSSAHHSEPTTFTVAAGDVPKRTPMTGRHHAEGKRLQNAVRRFLRRSPIPPPISPLPPSPTPEKKYRLRLAPTSLAYANVPPWEISEDDPRKPLLELRYNCALFGPNYN
ncbi:hypothetical protein PPYR_06151 [Photinus pyralis]|uniref:Uncharacterized protein n=1 Tax=Photinus pyralis TaxID=7054 RepID=A0A5N4ASU5_PHOPY|nr:hypothetical protein PPYR_06151 [Photinus pyralis]